MTSIRTWRWQGIAAFALLGAALSGCAGHKPAPADTDVVHLHASTLSPRDQTAIRNALSAEGFKVVVRDNSSPFADNTLIYHPVLGYEGRIERIRVALDTTEYAAKDLYARQARNHHYTPGHVGLYLRAEGAEPPNENEVLAEIPFNLTDAEFTSRTCDSTYILEFAHDGTVVVFDIKGDDPLARLRWTEAGDRVTLRSGMTSHHYEKSISATHDGPKAVMSIVLTPEDEGAGPYGCEFQGRTHAQRLN